MRTERIIALAIVLGLVSLAYGQRVARPVLTLVQDGGGGVRPLIGIPGAASVGAAFDLGFPVDRLAASDESDYALAIAGVDRQAVWIRPHASGLSTQPVTLPCEWEDYERGFCTAVAQIDRIALSPSGSAAALWSESAERIYILTDAARDPGSVIDIAINGYGAVTAIAIADGGQTVAFGTSDGAVYFTGPYQAPALRAWMRHAAIISFLRASADAIVADDQDNIVYSVTGAGAFPIAALGDAGVSSPVGIAASHDNSKIFIAGSDGVVATLTADGTVVAPVHCNCTITGLHRTRINSVFRLTDFTGAPLVLFDGAPSTPRTVFAPASQR